MECGTKKWVGVGRLECGQAALSTTSAESRREAGGMGRLGTD